MAVDRFCICPKGGTSLVSMCSLPFSPFPDPQREWQPSAVRAVGQGRDAQQVGGDTAAVLASEEPEILCQGSLFLSLAVLIAVDSTLAKPSSKKTKEKEQG